jgi:hypothetical protein
MEGRIALIEIRKKNLKIITINLKEMQKDKTEHSRLLRFPKYASTLSRLVP